MFRWYQNTARCYVYLSDVVIKKPKYQTVHTAWESALQKSLWFTRGWTLQELLAPKFVDFYSQDRVILGNKDSLEQQIAEITGIPIEALRGQSLSDFSVGERFRWVEKRQTTEEETRRIVYLAFLTFLYHPYMARAKRGPYLSFMKKFKSLYLVSCSASFIL